MGRVIRGLILIVFLVVAVPQGRSAEMPEPAIASDIVWLTKVLVPDFAFEINTSAPPSASLLPEAIPMPPVKPMIAIVVDDMGLDLKRSARAVRNLDASVTLSYLPYARNVQKQVTSAREHGHEVILHMPWESDTGREDPGPNHLSVSMSKERLQKNMLANLESFEGYVGINNHMGSRFSRYRPGLEIVMAEVKKRGIEFLDSRTTHNSIAEKVAREYNIPVTHRDVFLDHVGKAELLTAALRETENIARRKGMAVAIGHPKDITLAALEAWLPTLEAKGFQLVPLTTVIRHRQIKADANIASK